LKSSGFRTALFDDDNMNAAMQQIKFFMLHRRKNYRKTRKINQLP